jgi:hypothetical protein
MTPEATHLLVYERQGPMKFDRPSCRENARGRRVADPKKVTCRACQRTRLFKMAIGVGRARGEHRCDATGYCTRCALPHDANGGLCPPGFWMTEGEVSIWEALKPKDRSALERKLGLRSAKATDRG